MRPILIPVQGGDPRPVGKILAVGRNYADHAVEMKAAPEPVLFLKPDTSIRLPGEPVRLPRDRGSVHHELELVVWLAHGGTALDEVEAAQLPGAYGLGLDLTLRDIQAEAKAKGRPWAVAKGFDGALPLGPFIPAEQIPDPTALTYHLEVNGKEVQKGVARDMILSVPRLLSAITQWITLEPGDLVLTGTPSGVGPVVPGDNARMVLDGHYDCDVRFI